MVTPGPAWPRCGIRATLWRIHSLATRTFRRQYYFMTSQSPLAHAKAACFVSVTDRARAKTFYGQTLGLILKHEDNFATVFESNGTTLRVSPAKDFRPQPFTVMGWEVPEIKA